MKKFLVLALFVSAIAIPFVPAQAQQQTTVYAYDNYFSPGTITVPVGSTVIWMNRGVYPHTVTADNGTFNSGIINPGVSFTYTFSTPGTYRYYCGLHGAPGGRGMAGTVVVTVAAGGSYAYKRHYGYGYQSYPYYYSYPYSYGYTYTYPYTYSLPYQNQPYGSYNYYSNPYGYMGMGQTYTGIPGYMGTGQGVYGGSAYGGMMGGGMGGYYP